MIQDVIKDKIKPNGKGDITGQVLQDVLLEMANTNSLVLKLPRVLKNQESVVFPGTVRDLWFVQYIDDSTNLCFRPIYYTQDTYDEAVDYFNTLTEDCYPVDYSYTPVAFWSDTDNLDDSQNLLTSQNVSTCYVTYKNKAGELKICRIQ